MKASINENKINYKKIKRDLLKRDMSLDSRFTTKVGKSKNKYKRNKRIEEE